MEVRFLHRDGWIVWGQVSKFLLRDDRGEPLYFINQIQDITERKMAEEDHMLNEFVVKATKVKIAYKGDTVVYNADAFNLSKGSMLDDLVKQMPGVELKDNGEIYQNGKKVDYLMLNGKQFFKGKNKVMLENLPYYTVKNVQFYNRTTDKSAYLGHDVEKKEFVMDVNLKPEYSTGYTVNAEVAGGTKDRYLSRLFGLRYTDNTRISLYGNMNNVNEYRSPGRDGDWTPANSPEGLMDIKRGGIDIALEDKEQRYANYFNGEVTWYKGDNASRTSSESFLTNGNSYTRSESNSKPKYLWMNASNYFMLKKTECPLVIVECGYLSNNRESSLLLQDDYQDKVAWGLHLAIMQYINKSGLRTVKAKLNETADK